MRAGNFDGIDTTVEIVERKGHRYAYSTVHVTYAQIRNQGVEMLKYGTRDVCADTLMQNVFCWSKIFFGNLCICDGLITNAALTVLLVWFNFNLSFILLIMWTFTGI